MLTIEDYHFRLNCVDVLKDGGNANSKKIIKQFREKIFMNRSNDKGMCTSETDKTPVLSEIDNIYQNIFLESTLESSMDPDVVSQYKDINYGVIDAGWSKSKFIEYGFKNIISVIENQRLSSNIIVNRNVLIISLCQIKFCNVCPCVVIH